MTAAPRFQGLAWVETQGHIQSSKSQLVVDGDGYTAFRPKLEAEFNNTAGHLDSSAPSVSLTWERALVIDRLSEDQLGYFHPFKLT
jgi:hypothetical protein